MRAVARAVLECRGWRTAWPGGHVARPHPCTLPAPGRRYCSGVDPFADPREALRKHKVSSAVLEQLDVDSESAKGKHLQARMIEASSLEGDRRKVVTEVCKRAGVLENPGQTAEMLIGSKLEAALIAAVSLAEDVSVRELLSLGMDDRIDAEMADELDTYFGNPAPTKSVRKADGAVGEDQLGSVLSAWEQPGNVRKRWKVEPAAAPTPAAEVAQPELQPYEGIDLAVLERASARADAAAGHAADAAAAYRRLLLGEASSETNFLRCATELNDMLRSLVMVFYSNSCVPLPLSSSKPLPDVLDWVSFFSGELKPKPPLKKLELRADVTVEYQHEENEVPRWASNYPGHNRDDVVRLSSAVELKQPVSRPAFVRMRDPLLPLLRALTAACAEEVNRTAERRRAVSRNTTPRAPAQVAPSKLQHLSFGAHDAVTATATALQPAIASPATHTVRQLRTLRELQGKHSVESQPQAGEAGVLVKGTSIVSIQVQGMTVVGFAKGDASGVPCGRLVLRDGEVIWRAPGMGSDTTDALKMWYVIPRAGGFICHNVDIPAELEKSRPNIVTLRRLGDRSDPAASQVVEDAELDQESPDSFFQVRVFTSKERKEREDTAEAAKKKKEEVPAATVQATGEDDEGVDEFAPQF
eukprot:TRINITY_DN15422_c0_g1_i1.p1 TRINITY_DN15422_c0_g1~~TRINITY_DN15422_c0_g1_i1.p1  ORF type:complete len:662 (+),score=160.86 TRINITY_DN15422_c0_g1_i1:62-1987(+)